MTHCGNLAPHDAHENCPGTPRRHIPENVVMNTYHALMVFTTLFLIHRWIQQHRQH